MAASGARAALAEEVAEAVAPFEASAWLTRGGVVGVVGGGVGVGVGVAAPGAV